MKMVFVHGFFHADPHPANILVRDPDHLSLVDFGMSRAAHARATARRRCACCWTSSTRTPSACRAACARWGCATRASMEEELGDRLGVILQRYSASAIGEIDAREVLREIFETIYRLDITLPARWVMLDKTLATLVGRGARDLPRPQRVRGRPALRAAAGRPALPPRRHGRPRARGRRRATPRRSSTTRSSSPSSSTSSRTATSRSRSAPRGSPRRWTRSRRSAQPPRAGARRRGAHRRLGGDRGVRPLDRPGGPRR